VAAVILAAGLSTRFGSEKLTRPLAGKPLAHHAIEAALASSLDRVLVVTRPGLAEPLDRAFPGAEIVINEQAAQGQSSSLRLGVEALRPRESHVLFLLADQPLVSPDLIDSFVAAARTGEELAALAGDGRLSPPTLFGRRFFAELAQARGDAGGRGLLAAQGDRVLALPPNHPLAGLDVDRPQDLARAEAVLAGRLGKALGLRRRELVSVVGAGGKSSLVAALASERAAAGQAVLATSTTQVYHPPGRLLMEQDPQRLLADAAQRLVPGWLLNLATDSRVEDGRVKLQGLSPGAVDRLWEQNLTPLLLVEADGARRMPLKAPRAHEPATPSASSLVVGVMGLGGVGKPVDEKHIFAPHEFSTLTGAARGQAVGPGHLAALALHPQGLFKNAPPLARRVVLMNQGELPGAARAAREIAAHIQEKEDSSRVVLASLAQGWSEVLASGG
jgi:probable selenium-dependent hydroxylase accessory protein YqeC